MSGPLAQKNALVTGASQGIGAAIAKTLVGAGARVCLAARSADALKLRAAEFGGDCSTARLDLADGQSIAALCERFASGLDILVNCGGTYGSGLMADAVSGEFEHLLKVNLVGPYEVTRLLQAAIVKRRGQIVFINSSIVNGGGATTGQFAATNHALRAIADSLRAEVNPSGVRVLSVYPGRTATPRQERIFEREQREYRAAELLQPDDIAATVLHSLCAPPNAEITDVFVRPARNFTR